MTTMWRENKQKSSVKEHKNKFMLTHQNETRIIKTKQQTMVIFYGYK